MYDYSVVKVSKFYNLEVFLGIMNNILDYN